MPQRLQRRRTKGWKKPPGSICVDRSTHFGNPFNWKYLGSRAKAVTYFRRWLKGTLSQTKLWEALAEHDHPVAALHRLVALNVYRQNLLARLPELRGRDLACYCPLPEPEKPDHCHAVVLIEWANAEPQP